MSLKATSISVVGASVVSWGLAGLWHMVIIADMEHEAWAKFSAVLRPEDAMPSPFWWMIPLMVFYWAVSYFVSRGPGGVSAATGMRTAVIVAFVVNFMAEFSMHMFFNDMSMGMSAMSLGFELVSAAVGGSVLGLLYSKLNT